MKKFLTLVLFICLGALAYAGEGGEKAKAKDCCATAAGASHECSAVATPAKTTKAKEACAAKACCKSKEAKKEKKAKKGKSQN